MSMFDGLLHLTIFKALIDSVMTTCTLIWGTNLNGNEESSY
jgi:hypothetical protein